MDKFTIKGLTFEPYIKNEEIQKQVKRVAQEITRDCADKSPIFIGVLNGAFIFTADLFRQIEFDAEIQFMRYKSYEGTSTNGHPVSLIGLTENIKDRTVIIVEDIVDTGHTIVKMIEDLRKHEPREIKVATLLFKPDSLKFDFKPDYVCFSIPPKFILGYGLDIDGLARNLPDIYVLSEPAKE